MSLHGLFIGFVLLGVSATPDTSSISPVWPPAPDRPRVRHVRTIASGADLQPAGGILDGVLGLLFGDRDARPWLIQPVGIAVSPSGLLAVADPGIHGVHLIDPGEQTYRLLTETETGVLQSPVGVAFDTREFLYVSDSERGCVAVFDEDGDPEFMIKDGLNRPTGLLVARDTLYVVDTGSHRIVRFDAKGRFLAASGTRGKAGGEFNFPIQLAGGDTLFVVDALNYRVQRLTPSGEYLSAFGSQGNGLGTFAGPKAIARDSEGHLYVTDALLDNIQIFDCAGRLLLVVGRQGNADGEFMSPTGIAIDRNDRIYIVDGLNRRIQVLQYLQ